MLKPIIKELKEHVPMTFLGAFLGIVLVFVFLEIPHKSAERFFYICHPAHVLLSAIATAGMYQKYQCPIDRKKCNPLLLLAVGYIGAIGIATLSDSVIPFLGEKLLNMEHAHVHIGFIEKPWLINIMALLGITIAYFNPKTKFPHLGHVLLSTFASLFHVLMARHEPLSTVMYGVIMLFLFISVWLPCCISDIVFPLLFVKSPHKGCKE